MSIAVSTACSASSLNAMSRAELRRTALQHYYEAERRAQVAPDLAFDRMEAFGRWLDKNIEAGDE